MIAELEVDWEGAGSVIGADVGTIDGWVALFMDDCDSAVFGAGGVLVGRGELAPLSTIGGSNDGKTGDEDRTCNGVSWLD